MKAPEQQRPPGSPSRTEMRDAVARLKPWFLKSGGFSMVASLLTLMSSWYMLEVYDRVVNSRNFTTLVMLTMVVLGAYAMMEVLEWVHDAEMHEAGMELDRAMSDRVFRAAFDANLRRVPGGSLQPMVDLKTVRDFLPSPVIKSLFDLPVALVFLALLFLISPVLGYAGIAGALLQTLVTWLNERATQPPLAAANRSAIAAQQYADGSVRNAQVIEAMGMLRAIHGRWYAKQREFLDFQALASDRAGVYTALARLLQLVLSSALLGIGAYLLLNRELNGGGSMLIIGSLLGGRVLQPLVVIVTQWRTAVNARDALNRLDGLLAAVPSRPDGMELPAPRGRLTAEQIITAAPGTQTPILRGVSFVVNPGEVLAVIGPSASGKTTLARVLTGLWTSAGGKARLDGADIYTWNKTELGPHVGYLPQGVELFDGTLAENIARFGEVDMHKVEAAARCVGLHEFIMDLPEGYDTEVGSEGARLSGGQRQRVGLARALYGDPVFIVLDEPNSSLDESGEAALASAIMQHRQRGATFVVITHRANLLGLADKVLLLRDGAVDAFGPRDDVLAAMRKAAQDANARAQQAAQHAAQQAALAQQPQEVTA